MSGIEPEASFLPRTRSTTELHRRESHVELLYGCRGQDSNLRSPKAPDLQSGTFDRSATTAFYK